jgi:predicted TIM-barrel fold metal-dependent hydrolase
MQLTEFIPKPMLVTPQNTIDLPRFPAVDAHNHLGGDFGPGWIGRPVEELLEAMDQMKVKRLVDLDGGWGETILETHLDIFKKKAPERFAMFGGVNWQNWKEVGNRFPETAAARLRAQAARGAQGLKVWKPFGLSVRDGDDRLVRVNDSRLDPIWQTAAELRLPVMIHVADPVAFFLPLDATNERWEELQAHPDWHFPSPPYPPFLQILEDLASLVERHPQTIFIGAHVGCYAENLQWVGRLLERCPNFYVDISARISELGRQPYSARRFFMQFSDRILFGTDVPPQPAMYQVYYRFLESEDEYFPYDLGPIPGQGRWNIYGLHLPEEVLANVYYRNAERIIFTQENRS